MGEWGPWGGERGWECKEPHGREGGRQGIDAGALQVRGRRAKGLPSSGLFFMVFGGKVSPLLKMRREVERSDFWEWKGLLIPTVEKWEGVVGGCGQCHYEEGSLMEQVYTKVEWLMCQPFETLRFSPADKILLNFIFYNLYYTNHNKQKNPDLSKMLFKTTGPEIGSRWRSRRTCSHSVLWEHWNHN